MSSSQRPAARSFQLVDSTLREGEQFARARFRHGDRLAIARGLDRFGVEWIELTSPASSPAHARAARALSRAGLRARLAAHVRCHAGDVEAALATGVDGVHVYLGATARHRQHSHGRDRAGLARLLEEVLPRAVASGSEVRFSCEDAFRTPPRELLRLLQLAEDLGVHRVGLADTVGAASPQEVARVVDTVRMAVSCDIEFHGHNDGGCAVANAYAAYEAGATHVDVTLLGIGERNGITSLGGLVARLAQVGDPGLERYALALLPDLDRLVAGLCGIEVPFNACLSAPTAFAHKAGVHAKAVLADPSTYESIAPERFGLTREVLVAHALTGRHAVAARARALGLALDDAAVRAATAALKRRAARAPLGEADVDALLRRHATLGGAAS